MTATMLFADYEKAELLLAQGDLHSAADLCKQMLNTDPGFAHGYHLMSSLFRTTGNFGKALNFSQLAISIEPGVSAFHMQQGQVFFALEEWDSARQSFADASALDTKNPHPLLLWAATLARQGEHDEARVLFTRARTLADLPEIDEHEGNYLLARGDLDAAELLCERLVRRMPDYFQAHILKGKILFERLQDNQAQASFARAWKLNPNAYEAIHYMALLAERAGDNTMSVHYVMQAVQVNPMLMPSLMLLGLLLLKRQDYPAAEHVFRQALYLKPNGQEVMHGLVTSLVLQHKRDDALRYVETVRSVYPDHPVFRFFKAMLSGEIPDAPPLDYIIALFDGYMQQFDAQVKSAMRHHTASLLAEMVENLPQWQGKSEASLLDLGCGTGLMAASCRHFTRARIGVDISEKMLEKAKSRQLYDTLYALDIVEYMTGSDRVVDIVAAADVLGYVGNVRPFLSAARNVMGPQSVLAFNICKEESVANFCLSKTGIYSHSPEYIALMAQEEGYRVLAERAEFLRMEDGQTANGMLYILQKLQLH